MKPDTRNLSVNMRGEDVKLLQKRLSKLGFSIEDKDGFFGKTTRRAVLDIQKKRGMKATGIVDEATDEVIKTDAQQRFTVHGRVMRSDGAALEGVTVSAVDMDAGGENLLGTMKTETDGGMIYPLQAQSHTQTQVNWQLRIEVMGCYNS